MGLNPKSENIEGGLKVYTTTNDRPSEFLRPTDAVDFTVAQVIGSYVVDRPCVVSSFDSRISAVTDASNVTDTIIAVQYRDGTDAAGSGTSVASLTVAATSSAVGDEDTSSNISAVQIAAGSVIEVEVTQACTGATTLTGHFAVGVSYVD